MYNQLKQNYEDLELRKAIATKSFMILWDTLEGMYKLMSEKYVESIPNAVRREMDHNLNFMMDQVRRMLPNVPIVVKPPKEGEER